MSKLITIEDGYEIRFVRDIMIKCVETGVLVLYRMIESPLNSMYTSK